MCTDSNIDSFGLGSTFIYLRSRGFVFPVDVIIIIITTTIIIAFI